MKRMILAALTAALLSCQGPAAVLAAEPAVDQTPDEAARLAAA